MKESRFVAVLLALAFAGCLQAGPQGSPATSDPFGGTVRTHTGTFVDPIVDPSSPTGSLKGQILNVNGVPLGGAYVTLLATKNFTYTGNDGRFAFQGLTPKTYVLRVDLTGYQSLEEDVVIVAGEVRSIDVVLEAANNVDESIAHFHDRWNGKTQVTLYDRTVSVPPQSPTCVLGNTNAAVSTSIQVKVEGPNLGTCYYIYMYPDGDKIVLPGAKDIKATISWDKQDYLPTIEFGYLMANVTAYRTVTGVTSGSTVNIPVVMNKWGFINMTDHGHQSYSQWAFRITVKPTVADRAVVSQDDFIREFIGDFQVKIVVNKGDEIPPEGGHARYWKKGPALQILAGVPQTLDWDSTITRDPRDACRPAPLCFRFPADVAKIVPPGATRMRIYLNTTFGNEAFASEFAEKGLALRTASMPVRTTTLDQMKVPTATSHSLSSVLYEFPIDSKDTAPYYQKRSNWLLLVGDLGDEKNPEYTPGCRGTPCGGETFTLSVFVFNDNWTPAMAS